MAKTSRSRNTTPANKSSNLPAKVDDFFQTEVTGFESMEQADLATPMLKIAQKTSPQADQYSDTSIDGLKPGMFFNPSTGTVYGKTVNVIVLGYFANVVQWGKDLGTFKKSYTREEFEKIKKNLTPFKNGLEYKNDEEDRFIDTRNFFLFLPDFPEEGIILFPCSSSAIKGAKVLNSKCRTLQIPGTNKVCIYAGVWELKNAIHKKDGNDWYKLGGPKGDQINRIGFVHIDYKNLMSIVKSSFEIAQENIRSNKIAELNYAGAKDERVINDEEDDIDF